MTLQDKLIKVKNSVSILDFSIVKRLVVEIDEEPIPYSDIQELDYPPFDAVSIEDIEDIVDMLIDRDILEISYDSGFISLMKD